MILSSRDAFATTIVLLGLLMQIRSGSAQGAPDTVAAMAAWSRSAPTPQTLTDASVATALVPANRRGDASLKQPRLLTAALDTASSLVYGWGYKTSWGGFAFARAVQAEKGSCGPIDNVGMREFLDWCRRVFESYLRSYSLDRAFAPTILDLNQITPYPRLWATAVEELASARAALARGGLPPAARTQLQRLELFLAVERDPPSESSALLSAAGPEVITPGERLYLQSILEGVEGRGLEGARSYGRAAGAGGPGQQDEWILRDLALVGEVGDTAVFARLDHGARVRWLDEFWSDRDFADGRAGGDRFAEHARRWRVALGQYRVADRDDLLRKLPDDKNAVMAMCKEEGNTPATGDISPFCTLGGLDIRARLLDDRGFMYMRHGEPPRRANYPGLQGTGTETWLYTLRDRPALAHFSKVMRNITGMFSRSLSTGDWIATCELAAFYCVLDARKSLKSLSQERVVRVQELAVQDRNLLAATDDIPQRFAYKLQMAGTAIGLGRRPGVATLVADISLRDLVAHATDDATKLALRWQVRMRNAAKEWVVSLDTVRRYRLPAMPNGPSADAYLTVMLEVPVPPGTHDVKLMLSDTTAQIGAEYSRSGLVVEDPSVAAGLSDLMLLPDGEQGAAASIEGTAVRLSPSLTPGRAKFLGIGYILSGVADREVPVSVTVTQVGKESDAPAVQVKFLDHPTTARAFRTQRIGVDALKTGTYTLQVTAEPAPGTRLVRSQVLVIR